ncbi:ROK family protein, partial [Escherichia coli]|uniref:ROK family protein n=1 Tax=Escherichia coli TaxID=562 RepID=UPI0034D96BC5
MYYGFDIGGTKIALGVFDSGRQLQLEKLVPTLRDSYVAFLDAVCELVAEADQRFGCKGSVGSGIPALPETEDGTRDAHNVPAARGQPLLADRSHRLPPEG